MEEGSQNKKDLTTHSILHRSNVDISTSVDVHTDCMYSNRYVLLFRLLCTRIIENDVIKDDINERLPQTSKRSRLPLTFQSEQKEEGLEDLRLDQC
jgi:hypothetical protein